MLAALANPHRMRIIGLLASDGRNYVSQLAREVGISRPLLHLHLTKLEDAGLVATEMVANELETAAGKAKVANIPAGRIATTDEVARVVDIIPPCFQY